VVLDSDPDQSGQPAAEDFVLPDPQNPDQDAPAAMKAIAHRPLRTDTNDPVVQMVDFPRG
jgi:hypothetical protein